LCAAGGGRTHCLRDALRRHGTLRSPDQRLMEPRIVKAILFYRNYCYKYFLKEGA